MATYVFECIHGTTEVEAPMERGPGAAPTCPMCGTMGRRFSVNIGEGVRVSKNGTLHEQRDLFLPTAQELSGPGDPDGIKGLEAWNDNHQPRPSNPNPLRPDRPPGSKRVF